MKRYQSLSHTCFVTLNHGFGIEKQSIKVNERSITNDLMASIIQVNAYLFIDNIRAYWSLEETDSNLTNVRYVVKAQKYSREENKNSDIGYSIQNFELSEMVCENIANDSICEYGNEHPLGQGV